MDEEKLKEREAAVKRREKDLQQLSANLDRRRAILEEHEERHGTMAAREAAVEAKEKDTLAMIKDARRREKQAKEAEARAAESSAALEEAEQRMLQREDEYRARKKELDRLGTKLDKQAEANEAKEKQLREEGSRLQDVALELEQQKTRLALQRDEQQARDRELGQTATSLDAQLKDVNRRMDAADRQAAATRTKLEKMKEREAEVAKEADAVHGAQRAHEHEEKQMRQRRAELQQLQIDCDRRVSIAEAQENNAKKRKDEALDALAQLDATKDALDRRKAELDTQESRLSRIASTNRASEDDVARRETLLANESKDLRNKERIYESRVGQFEAQQSSLEDRKRVVSDREDAVALRERNCDERERAAGVREQQCAASAAATQRRNEALDAKETDLVAWMKEMQWREMVLGADEELVQRQPVTPIVRPTKRSVVGQPSPSASPVIDGSVLAASRRQQSSVNLAASAAILSASNANNAGNAATVPPGGAAMTNVFPEGFAHRAFGHAVVSVQFRRLKDQYVSAQMRHARAEIAGNEDRKRAIAGRKRRMARAGIETSQPSGDLCREAEQQGSVVALEEHVRALSVSFSRQMAKLRAFDGYESPTSAEKIGQLEDFTNGEQAVLTMAANLEYVLRSVHGFLSCLESSPLDRKDKASDVQDLMNRTSRWWAKAKEAAVATTQQMLEDRQRYLAQAIAVLTAHKALTTTASMRIGRGGKQQRLPQGRQDDADDASVEATESFEDGGGQPPAEEPAAVWPYGSDLIPPHLLGSSTADDGGRNSPAGPTVGEQPYEAVSHVDHVRESAILAPRGLATLRAHSNAKESAAAPADAMASSARALHHHESASPSHGGGSGNRPMTAPTVTKPGAPPVVGGALGGPRAQPFRSPAKTESEEALMNMGARHHQPPPSPAGLVPRNGAASPIKTPFDLREFLMSPEAAKGAPSPYALAPSPLRPGSAASSSSAKRQRQQRASSAKPRTPLAQRKGLPPSPHHKQQQRPSKN